MKQKVYGECVLCGEAIYRQGHTVCRLCEEIERAEKKQAKEKTERRKRALSVKEDLVPHD